LDSPPTSLVAAIPAATTPAPILTSFFVSDAVSATSATCFAANAACGTAPAAKATVAAAPAAFLRVFYFREIIT